MIVELRSEIEKLKSQSGMMGSDPEIIVTSLAEISSLREQLLEKEREMQEITKSWQERLKKSEERKVQEAKSLEVSEKCAPKLYVKRVNQTSQFRKEW